MAGNRTGYLVGPAEAVAQVGKVSTHTIYSAPTAGQVAGLQALRGGGAWVENARVSYGEVAALAALDDVEHAERARSINSEGIDYLDSELGALGIETWPTDANFLLAKAGADTAGRLLREGIIVRALNGFGMPEHIRISIGLPEENERLIKTLRRLREGSL